jgi:glyoxylase-like metal-dependent hydrolase (beta-lactamase superfamily II)
MNWKLGILEVGVIPRLQLSLYLPDASPDELIDPVCYCYLASDGRRNVLVDSGPDRALAAAEGLEIIGNASERLAAGMRAWGIEPADIDHIVHTHLHHDHMQNDLMFANAVVHVQQAEIEWANNPDSGRFYFGVSELTDALGVRLNALDGDSELFPGLRVVFNGGHTPGHQSVIVDTNENAVCLCGDIVSLLPNIEVVGSICPNVEETAAFLDRARTAGWEMVPSHDPKIRGHRWYVQLADEDSKQQSRTED